jgi:hypothetical protein
MSSPITNNNVTRLLNVDLELVAAVDLGPLLSHVADATINLRDSGTDGRRTVWLELADDHPRDADAAVRAFVDLVGAFPPAVRELWNQCEDRCLNIGIQAEVGPHATAFRIESVTAAALAAVSARLEFTVYGTAIEPT